MMHRAALAAALSSPFRRSRFFFFSSPKFSGGIGCRPFLGSQPGRVLLYFSRAWALVALAHFRARALRVGFFAMAPNGLRLQEVGDFWHYSSNISLNFLLAQIFNKPQNRQLLVGAVIGRFL
jgi:hypothetical protein